MQTVNPYLNTPPTKLKRMIPKAKGKDRELMKKALWAWRTTIGNPLARDASYRVAVQYIAST